MTTEYKRKLERNLLRLNPSKRVDSETLGIVR